ncbi:positive regulator of sigma E activity [Priestia taiwanensis]|uniref:Uncharacterized protein n=1 Tax=Priestia taiwanensis TaxID=1347902 RepID=A0A917AYF0_9BACI|nr:positive regulator of sigma E activity [Priestia taiwanensis]GGE81163.1 hypothetical protein GCM10007140_33430 [Priestia taiwanensis]
MYLSNIILFFVMCLIALSSIKLFDTELAQNFSIIIGLGLSILLSTKYLNKMKINLYFGIFIIVLFIATIIYIF